jgi:PAS domain S-box-containing protein
MQNLNDSKLQIAIEKLKNENQQLKKENELQELLVEIASAFIGFDANKTDQFIDIALAKLGKFVNADRCYIFDYIWEQGIVKNAFEWCAEGIAPEIDNLQELSIDAVPSWSEAHKAQKLLYVADVDALPDDNVLKQILESQSIKSLITLPIGRGDICYGFVGFDYVKSKRDYIEIEKYLLGLFSQFLFNLKERKLLDQKIIAQEAKYKNIINNMNLGLIEVDKSDKIIFANHSFCQMSDYQNDELIGAEASELFLSKEDKEKMKQKLIDRSQGDADSYELEVFNKKGERRWWLVCGAPNYNDNLEYTGSIGIHFDITEKKKLQTEQEHLLELTNLQNGRLKNFAHIVSHNLRSHAANLKLISNELIESYPELQKDELANMLANVSSNLLDTIGHLSEVATMNVNEHIKNEKTFLQSATDRVIESVHAIARSNGVKLINEVDNDHAILAFPAYLESVILNLVTNAIKYASPERESFVKLVSQEQDGFIVLKVTDNGLGIDLNRHGAKLFGLYKTFHKHHDSKGVGLYITKNQIDAMGGKIEVESKPNEGSCFSVFFKKA